jgi:hypothetical protein
MSDQRWQDYVVGERMAVDRKFSDRVNASDFSSQEWGLIMTATEFQIENPEDPETARVVSDTSKVEQIAPELDNIQSSVNSMTAGGGSGGRGSGGFLGSVKDALGLGGGGGRNPSEVRSKADTLTSEYATLLQERLESQGKWEEVRLIAAGAVEDDVSEQGDR